MDAQPATQHTEPPSDTESLIRQAQQLIARPFGRPSEYNPLIAANICELLAQGLRTRQIAERDDMPSRQTIYTWLYRYPEFLDQWQRARENSVEPLADENLDIVDDTSNDIVYDQHGRPMPNMAAVKRAELKVNQRQWLMGKWSKRYADKQQIEHSGTVTLEMATRLDTALRRLDVIDVQSQEVSTPSDSLPKPVRENTHE